MVILVLLVLKVHQVRMAHKVLRVYLVNQDLGAYQVVKVLTAYKVHKEYLVMTDLWDQKEMT